MSELSTVGRSICIINNIPSPYRRELFDAMARCAADRGLHFSVLYIAKTEAVRDWDVQLRSFESLLPVLWQGRNRRTPTSDYIFNKGFLKRVLASDEVIVFGYNYPTYLITTVLRAILGRPIHLFCETTLFDSNSLSWKLLAKSLYFRKSFDRFVVPGRASAAYLAAHGIATEKIFYATNASSMRPEGAAVVAPNKRLQLLFVGRLAPEKRVLELIQAFSSLSGAYDLTLVGDGPLADQVEIATQNSPHITVMGSISWSDLSAVYRSCDVLVLPSRSEPWGLVVNEAVNHGLALILTPEVGAGPDLLDGNGVLLGELTGDALGVAVETVEQNLPAYKARSSEIGQGITVERQANSILDVVMNVPRSQV